jgi:uncharacterized protein
VRRRISRFMVSVVLPACVLGALWRPVPGWGLTLEEAKSQGIVGERPNGYLGVVKPGASAAAQALVSEVNQKRRQAYADISRRNTTSLEAVEMLAGETASKNTQPGNFIQLPSGQWRQK